MRQSFLLLLLLFSTLCLQAQNKRRALESNRYYMELGPGAAWMHGNPSLDASNNMIGYHFGLGFTKPLAGPLYTHTGFGVARKGLQAVFQLTDINGALIGLRESSQRLDYLLVPYLLRLELGDRLRFYTELGPYAAFLIRAEEQGTQNGQQFEPVDITEQYLRYDIGAMAGAGLGFSLMDNFFGTVGARYSMGLIDVDNDGRSPLKTTSLDLRIGLGVWINR